MDFSIHHCPHICECISPILLQPSSFNNSLPAKSLLYCLQPNILIHKLYWRSLNKSSFPCYNSKLIEVKLEKESYIKVNIRELNRVRKYNVLTLLF